LFFVEGRWDGTRIQETLVVMSPPLYPADRSLLPLYSPVTAPSTDSEWSSVPGPLDPGAPAASAYVNKVEATHKGGGYFKPDLVLQYHSSEHYNAFELGRLKLKQVRESFAAHAQDCGGSEVQIAALSEKVRYMTVHLQTHHKDHASRRGLLSMLERRKKLLMYLRRTNGDSYGEVIYRLGLKDKSPSEDRYLQHEPKKNAAKKKKAKN
jgi:small subunit ribosomal protein S15